ncbi:hypothetical protein [Sodaliphilus sp.]|uniref:hypothetical protein n=1 Tax=Sodaliphilus sp. TaxID=2815818 RepID=UPI00389045B0
MKRTLLLATVVVAMTASAHTKSEMAQQAPAMPEVVTTPEVVVETAPVHRLTAAEVKAQHKVAPKDDVKAWYNRPAGTMWQTYITTDNVKNPPFKACYAPYLNVNPWRNYTFESSSTGAVSQEWKVYYRRKITTYTTPSVDLYWGCQTDTIPVLTAYGTNGSSEYTPAGYNGSIKQASYINGYSNYIGQYKPGNSQHFWSSPKFFGSDSNRDGSVKSGAYTSKVNDASGQPAGRLMGKNSVNLNGMAIAAEAPVAPYVITRVGLRYQNLLLDQTSTVPITATIYKLNSVPAYNSDGAPVVMGEPSEVLATATVNVSTAWLATQREQYRGADGAYTGILPIALKEPLEVNSAILVCVDGYNVDAVNADFTSVYSADYFDEGHGEIGYLKTVDYYTGQPIFVGMCGGFVNSSIHTAPAVLLDVERRFLEFNKAEESGLWNAPAEKSDSIVDIFSYLPSAQINVKITEVDKAGNTLNDGNAPSWVSVTLKDQTDPWGNPLGSGIINMNVSVTDNSAQQRAAQIDLSFAGAHLVYNVVQAGTAPEYDGDVNGDGMVDIKDVNIAVNIILGKANKEDYPNGNKVNDIKDMNVILNSILGAK